MALIPGTLPNDTCYGTPQDLLELFAQYLDVPAFALSSKVVFSTTNTGFTSDIVWFDTTSATRPIMKITVSSSGFLDYVKNYITAAPVVTIVGADSVLILDASDSSNTKRGLVSDIAALAVPAAGSITPAQLAQPFTSGTAVAVSGTTIDFTGIPSWAKRVTVMFNGVSTTGASVYLIQIGSGSFTTSGYASSTVYAGTSTSGMSGTAGFYMWNGTSAEIHSGTYIISRFSGTTYVGSGLYSYHAQTYTVTGAGVSPSLVGALDRVRITTDTGTDTFDLGSVNIMYE
jgi:hypothetical protein